MFDVAEIAPLPKNTCMWDDVRLYVKIGSSLSLLKGTQSTANDAETREIKIDNAARAVSWAGEIIVPRLLSCCISRGSKFTKGLS